jgi:glutamate/tyrosine decarboxylase-like PLP-dependent enzyme
VPLTKNNKHPILEKTISKEKQERIQRNTRNGMRSSITTDARKMLQATYGQGIVIGRKGLT